MGTIPITYQKAELK